MGRLPGVVPIEMSDWLQVDDAYAAQMAYRMQILSDRRDRVLMLNDAAIEAADELLEMAEAQLPMLGFVQNGSNWTCPDGRKVERAGALETLAKLVQEDFLILDKQNGAHVLMGGVLCFPASWSLAEKFERTLDEIHAPVPEYSAVAGSVERMFSVLRPGRPLMRMNALRYGDPDLFHPHRGSDILREVGQLGYIRCERQTMLRLPRTGYAVFTIHTYQVPETAVAPEALAQLIQLKERTS